MAADGRGGGGGEEGEEGGGPTTTYLPHPGLPHWPVEVSLSINLTLSGLLHGPYNT